MRSPKFAAIALFPLLLVACATPKMAMSDAEYSNVASKAATLQACSRGGMLSPELTAFGQLVLQGHLSNFTYDSTRLIQEASQYPASPNSTECNGIAVELASVKQRYANQQQAQAEPQPSYRLPARTICNNIAGQMLCSTY